MAKLYENENISEPTYEGKWWRDSGDGEDPLIETVWYLGGKMQYGIVIDLHDCREKGVTWTGPIPEPVPEDKPEPSDGIIKCPICFGDGEDDEDSSKPCYNCKGEGVVRAAFTEDKPAPSEDEGKEWGRWLFLLIEQWFGYLRIGYWAELPQHQRTRWGSAAHHFHAECIAPWKDVVDKARAVLQAFRGYGDLVNESTKHNWSDEEVAAAERKVGSEVGGAMEALDDALDALLGQGEAPAEKQHDRGRLADVDAEGQVEAWAEDRPGCVCAVCGETVHPAEGRFVCYDCWSSQSGEIEARAGKKDKARLSDAELGRLAERLVNEARGSYRKVWLLEKLENIGIAIRAEMENAQVSPPDAPHLSDEKLAAIGFEAGVPPAKWAEAAEVVKHQWLKGIRAIRARLEGK